MYDDLTEQMELKEYKALYKLMPSDYKLSARILNMLWVNFCNEHEWSKPIYVTKESVARFVVWVESGNSDDARPKS